MSSNRVKTSYIQEVGYGEVKETNIYAIHNASNYCIYIYDDKGNLILSGEDNMMYAIADLIKSSGKEDELSGISNMDINDYKLIKK